MDFIYHYRYELDINNRSKYIGYDIHHYDLLMQYGGASKYKWNTLSHNGVLLTEPYIPHGVPLIYAGAKIILNPEAEEYANFYAHYLNDTEYVDKVFKKNFWKGWKLLLKDNSIASLDNCDFSLIYDHYTKTREKLKELSKEEKKRIKEERDEEEEKYKYAIIDGEKQKINNYKVEPPGLFIGRGCHPKLGSLKTRIQAEDVIINIGKEADDPKPPIGHKWKEVRNDRNVEWLASWKDNISGKNKYMWLDNTSKFKAQSDIKKFDLARKLKKSIGKIREAINTEMTHEEESIRQVATALYFIDNLALRVGNEKGDDKADTVGVTSLRVEHIKLLENSKITLDFLGKDSIRYLNTVVVDPQVYKNLQEFMKDKKPIDSLFNKIDANLVNQYLQSFMSGLTAKVFRTFNASNTFQKELNKVSKKHENEENQVNEILDGFQRANIKVAILCNHQKKISKGFNNQILKINENIQNTKKKLNEIRRKKKKTKTDQNKIKKLKEKISELKSKKNLKIEMKSISLDTSKANYIDPRITFAFVKKHNLDINKIYSKQLVEKFNWASDIDANFKF